MRYSGVAGAVVLVVGGATLAFASQSQHPGAAEPAAAAGAPPPPPPPPATPSPVAPAPDAPPSSPIGAAGNTRALSAGAMATPPGTVSPVARTVSYLGHTFTVPAGWRLVNLATDPTACVRFDVHAVYLGAPSPDQQCATQGDAPVQGAVLIAPSHTANSVGATDDAVQQRITATLPGVAITASYGADRSAVAALLTTDGLPTPTAVDTTSSTAQTAARIAANLTPLQGPISPDTVAQMTEVYAGLGFDACTAPSTDQLSAWSGSPYAAVGIYIGGADRACTQPDLTASWVTAETSAGWHLLPLYVGPQIAGDEITDAAAQGKASADDAATQASALGIGEGAVLYYDMEGGVFTSTQTATTQAFLTAWTDELHALHYRAAVYGSETGAVGAAVSGWGSISEPDVLDIANWNGQADDDPGSDPGNDWAGHRVHQFEAGANATYGGVTINIDEDYFGLTGYCTFATPGARVQPQDMPNCAASPVAATASAP
jgi:hypothetical protein